MTETLPVVGTTRVSRKPWAPKSRRYSASVRFRPPAATIMCRSSHLPNDAPSPDETAPTSGRTYSTRRSRAPGRHGAAEVVEDAAGLGVVPVVDDVAEHVGVAADGGPLEEVATLDVATLREARGLQHRTRTLDNARQVEEQAPHGRISAEDAGQSRAGAAADVGQGLDAGEVVGVEDRPRFSAAEAGHRGVEDPGLLGVFAQIVEDRPAEQPLEGRLAGPHGLEQVAPAAMLLLAQHDRHRPHGIRPILAEELGRRVEAESSVGLLGEHALVGQGAENSIQRPGRHADRGGDLSGRPRAGRQVVGDPELRGGVDRPRHPGADDPLEDLLPGLSFTHGRSPFSMFHP